MQCYKYNSFDFLPWKTVDVIAFHLFLEFEAEFTKSFTLPIIILPNPMCLSFLGVILLGRTSLTYKQEMSEVKESASSQVK